MIQQTQNIYSSKEPEEPSLKEKEDTPPNSPYRSSTALIPAVAKDNQEEIIDIKILYKTLANLKNKMRSYTTTRMASFQGRLDSTHVDRQKSHDHLNRSRKGL